MELWKPNEVEWKKPRNEKRETENERKIVTDNQYKFDILTMTMMKMMTTTR